MLKVLTKIKRKQLTSTRQTGCRKEPFSELQRENDALKKVIEELKSNLIQSHKERDSVLNTITQSAELIRQTSAVLMNNPYCQFDKNAILAKVRKFRFIWTERDDLLELMIDHMQSPKFKMINPVEDKTKFKSQHFTLHPDISSQDLTPNYVKHIIWRRDIRTLHSILCWLCDNGLLEYSQKPDLIKLMNLHFLDKDGNTIDVHSTEVNLGNRKSNSKARETHIVEEMISVLEKARSQILSSN